MSQTQSDAAGAASTTEAEGGLGLLDQVIGATKQTERDRAQDLIKALTEEALKGTVTFSRNLSQTFDKRDRRDRRRSCQRAAQRRSCTMSEVQQA
jgi:type VI secretion system protein ImpC